MSDGVLYKSYDEVASIAAQPGSVLVVPVGSVEQHGHHLPVGTDSLLTESVAYRGVEQLDDDRPVAVTPTVWTGYSPHHRSFGGTVSLEANRLVRVLGDIVTSLLTESFDGVLLVNGHGGNVSQLDTAVSVIGNEHPAVDLLEGGAATVYRDFGYYSDSGAVGAPELASAEKGAELFDLLGEQLAQLLDEIHEANRSEGADSS